jgi:glutamate racemase
MMMKRNVSAALAIVALATLSLSCGVKAPAPAPSPAPLTGREAMIQDVLRNREDVTILITDSGLGGLSVVADVVARLPESGVFRNARVVFYNALFHASGYNSLDTDEEKALVFDMVLEAMQEQYQPDLILIACNTLSVIYDQTDFARNEPAPVIGIVETGVDVIAEQLKQAPDATALIFGTETTIESAAYQDKLRAAGFPEQRIVGQSCPGLAAAIERGTDTEETVGMIRQYVGEALARTGGAGGPVFGSFNCTHYGYARQQWAAAFAAAGYPDVLLVDPNPRMADFLFSQQYLGRYPRTEVTVEVVSKLEITEQERNAIGPLLRAVSPATADALANYRLDTNLF